MSLSVLEAKKRPGLDERSAGVRHRGGFGSG